LERSSWSLPNVESPISSVSAAMERVIPSLRPVLSRSCRGGK
jgi:hypothetical protein